MKIGLSFVTIKRNPNHEKPLKIFEQNNLMIEKMSLLYIYLSEGRRILLK